MSKIIATFNPKSGEVSYSVEGIMGPECKSITELLTQGLEVLEEKETEEFYVVDEPAYVEDM
jgi:hypothetical protein